MFDLGNILKKTKLESSEILDPSVIQVQQTLGATISKDAENITAKFENSFEGGVPQLEKFENSATQTLETFNNNVSDIADKTITAVTGETQNLVGNVKTEANKILNANGEVTSEFDSIGNGSTGSVDLTEGDIGLEQGENTIQMSELIVPAKRFRPNVLERFISANYVFTIGVLTDEEVADPDGTYIKNGAKHVILKSAGGINALRQQGSGRIVPTTAMEEAIGGKTEYFIEDITLKQSVSPSPNSRLTNVNDFSFKIIEPYSMGQWLETLEVAARRAGHQNYQEAPFLLSIDWVGYLQEPKTAGGSDFTESIGELTRLSNIDGETERHIPFKLSQSNMTVSTRGTEYEIDAYAWNMLCWKDLVQKIPIDVSISGETVEQMLQSGAQSLTTVLNTNLLKREEDNERVFADEYIIIFPIKQESNGSAAQKEAKQEDTNISDRNITEADGLGFFVQGKDSANVEEANPGFSFEEWTKHILGVSIKRNRLSEAMKTDAVQQQNINTIGKAKIVFDGLQDGSQAPNPAGIIYDINKQVHKMSAIQISKTNREIKFSKDTHINKIIEEIVIISDFGRNLVNRAVSEDGSKEWFRIEGQVFNIPVEKAEVTRGRKPRLYVYRVIPYRVNMGLIEKPTEPAIGMEIIKNNIVKEYNYIYTGQNKDIIDFDMHFENRFMTVTPVDKGGNQVDIVSAGKSATAEKQNSNSTVHKDSEGDEDNVRGPLRTVGAVSIQPAAGGMRGVPGNEKEQIARLFHQALIMSGSGDMLDIELKIWGDPYFITDSGMGNYNSPYRHGDQMVDERGQMVYQRQPLFIQIEFRTPLDYGDDGIVVFNQASDNATKNTQQLEKFSGIYRVLEIESEFRGGRFEQNLICSRVNSQAQQLAMKKKADRDKSTGAAIEEAGKKVDQAGSAFLGRHP
jgi:hypothetical protein